MNNPYESAQLLTALWRLGGGSNLVPTSQGILDAGLHAVRNDLPAPLDRLTFSMTAVGLRCVELPGILLAAQEAMLTSDPGPAYQFTSVTLEEDEARQIVVGAGVSSKEARSLGTRLLKEIRRMKERIGTMVPVAA